MNGRPFPPRAVVWNSRKGLEIGHSLVLEQVSNVQGGESVGCAPWAATPSSVAPLWPPFSCGGGDTCIHPVVSGAVPTPGGQMSTG